MKASDVLADARGIILTYGLARRTYYNPHDGSFCAKGAIFMAAGALTNPLVANWSALSPAARDGSLKAMQYLRRACGDYDIPHWNDARGRTETEVLDTFDQAIILAKEAGE